MKHDFKYWVVFVLLAIWQLPQTLVAVLMMPFLGKMKLIADGHYNLCCVGENMSGGISLGCFCFVSYKIYYRYKSLETIAHEFNGHTVQSKWLGPLYLIVVGIPSALNAAFDITQNYYDFYTERWANSIAGLTYDTKYSDLLEFETPEAKERIQKYMI